VLNDNKGDNLKNRLSPNTHMKSRCNAI